MLAFRASDVDDLPKCLEKRLKYLLAEDSADDLSTAMGGLERGGGRGGRVRYGAERDELGLTLYLAGEERTNADGGDQREKDI
jgi:hypothetical protein